MSGRAVDYRGALEAVDRILNRGGDSEQVLSAVLDSLRTRGVPYASIRFGDRELTTGGRSPDVEARVSENGTVALAVDDQAFVERVATLVSPYTAGR